VRCLFRRLKWICPKNLEVLQKYRHSDKIVFCFGISARAIFLSFLFWHFSARFDCANRTYKYFFPRGNLSLARMAEAGERLCGVHDFRNFCKMDVNNGVVNYQRRIFRLGVSVISKENAPSSLPGKQSFFRMD
jgi:hypothetical protein